jgi:DNA helicase IV
MALNFFKQRDIDEMDPNDIPDEFINYFDSLSDERKAEIIASRPDLDEGLGYITPKLEEVATDSSEEKDTNSVKKGLVEIEGTEEISTDEEIESDEDEEDIFAQISTNLYENVNLDKVLVDGLNPVEALTLPDKTEKCPLHRTKLEKINIKYHSKTGSVYGIVLGLCRQCKRLFQEESQLKYVHKALVDRNINHTFYDIDLTNLYLRSQQSAYVLNADEKVYVPDTWVEEDPKCPIHEDGLYEIPCEKEFAGRKVSFTGYLCEHCNKILVRKAVAVDLVDECAMAGVPEIEYESLVKKVPKKKAIKPKEIRPDYFVQDGKRVTYNYDHNTDCFKLTEEDTVVVSDSVYCNLEDHDTEEVLVLIMVKEKHGGRKAYLFMVGYCAQCQKYYMEEEDYKVVYSVGRPEVTILSDIDSDSYQITSGEVFNLERSHLDRLESNIEDEISSIHNQNDYVNPYMVGDYDDGNLSFAKNLSQSKYGSRLEELAGYQPKPYSYRVDITCGGETETYYVGPSDIDLGGKRRVVSFNSDFGHELVNYQTLKINKNGIEYDIKLSRQFDIDHATLFGYANLRTDEDIIFRSGVTDPFLVRVLNMRKKQHNLIDIIATIQENQNKIVDADFEKNIIVQGCAGSGKTMVLLHRLSSLQYKQKYFNFGDQALILTPNDQFSLHIKGLAEGLQIGNIERISVEQYYVEMLCRYSDDFKLDAKLSSEMFVRQDYVDYIYSDQFKSDFEAAFKKVITGRNALAEILDNLTEAMGQPNRKINFEDNTKVIQQIKFGVDAMDGLIQKHETDVIRAKDALERVMSRKKFLEDRIPEAEQFAAGIVQESLPRVYAKISGFLSEKQGVITELEAQITELNAEKQKVQSAIIMFGKRARLDQIDKDIKEIERKLSLERKKAEGDYSVLSLSQEGKSDDEILEWMGQVMIHIKEVQDEVRLCRNSKHEAEIFRTELDNDLPGQILAAQEEVERVSAISYPAEATKAIQYLNDKLSAYTLVGTFEMIFNDAVAKFKEEHNVKTINGKYHRYDLYARLLFAMKFFNNVLGTTRFMCVDEGQDLAFNEYRLLFELNKKNITFNIYGDTNQLMKPGRGIADWSELRMFFCADNYTLNENYRNTNQITRFCNSSFGMDVLQTGVDGAKVREIARKELESELASLTITSERVAILVPRGVQKKKYLDMDCLPSNICSIIGDNMDNGYISMMYVDEVKGIEFDKVYVVGNKMTRNEKYIAFTRALSELILVVDDSVADYDDGSDKGKSDQSKKEKKGKKKTTSTGVLIYKNANHGQTFEVPTNQVTVTEVVNKFSNSDQIDASSDIDEELDVVGTPKEELKAASLMFS